MSGASYALRPDYGLLSHWNDSPRLVGDYISVDTEKLDIQIRSGDYFVTLATMLEVLSQRLIVEKNSAAIDFQQIADELLYLQHHYEIVKKSPTNPEQ